MISRAFYLVGSIIHFLLTPALIVPSSLAALLRTRSGVLVIVGENFALPVAIHRRRDSGCRSSNGLDLAVDLTKDSPGPDLATSGTDRD
ncbi:hypothetical protein U1Q18_013759 [Sarracenia purpurea var. burkii]